MLSIGIVFTLNTNAQKDSSKDNPYIVTKIGRETSNDGDCVYLIYLERNDSVYKVYSYETTLQIGIYGPKGKRKKLQIGDSVFLKLKKIKGYVSEPNTVDYYDLFHGVLVFGERGVDETCFCPQLDGLYLYDK